VAESTPPEDGTDGYSNGAGITFGGVLIWSVVVSFFSIFFIGLLATRGPADIPLETMGRSPRSSAPEASLEGAGVSGEGTEIQVAWDLDVAVRDNTLSVNGETNLPDGAVLYIEIIGTGGNVGLDDFAYTEVRVSQSAFRSTFPVGDWTANNIEVLVAFSNMNVSQPAAIQERIGTSGQGIRGPLATSRGHMGIFPDRRWAEEVVTIPRL
jgi:hypothetical protein